MALSMAENYIDNNNDFTTYAPEHMVLGVLLIFFIKWVCDIVFKN
jgi:hypothetical protein